VVREHVDEAGVAELVVDNPPVNAYNLADIAALVGHLRGYAGDPRVRAVVLRGEGRGFCGGGDVKEVQRLPGYEGILGQVHGSLDLSLAVAECPIPVIGAIHGYCIGLGVLVAGVCDILLAAPGTPFVLAEADNGATSGVVQASALMPDKRLRGGPRAGDDHRGQADHRDPRPQGGDGGQHRPEHPRRLPPGGELHARVEHVGRGARGAGGLRRRPQGGLHGRLSGVQPNHVLLD
jgi:hypothetical protein